MAHINPRREYDSDFRARILYAVRRGSFLRESLMIDYIGNGCRKINNPLIVKKEQMVVASMAAAASSSRR